MTRLNADQHQIERVLEPYFSTKKTGTGLGLPTVKRVVEEHGGTLTLASDVGKGTQFTLRLPGLQAAGEAEGDQAAVDRSTESEQ